MVVTSIQGFVQEKQKSALEILAEDDKVAKEIKARRNDLIRQARDEGCTWRAIALALGMTETAVMAAAMRP